MRQLMDRDLVKIAGRSEELGRPYLYATTRRFLQLFGLRSLEDLPRADQLRKQISTPNSDRQSSDTTEIRSPTASTDRDRPDRNRPESISLDRNEEETDVTATIRAELSPEELRKPRLRGVPVVLPRASDEDEDFAEEDEEEDDEFDDLDDDEEEDDFDDEEDDEEDFDDVDDEEEDFEDDEWEEVDDEDEEFEDDEEDDDWDDDEDDEEEEEEAEDWE